MSRFHSLHPGDILLFRPRRHSSSLVDTLIVFGQKLFRKVPSKISYCHVAIVDYDTRFMLEAVWPKTRMSKIYNRLKSGSETVEVYRVNKISNDQIKKVINWTHEHLNEWYNIPLFLTGIFSWKHSEICSTFVHKAFKSADLDVPFGCGNKKFIVPDDYYLDRKSLKRII